MQIIIKRDYQEDFTKAWFMVDSKSGKNLHDKGFQTLESITDMSNKIKKLIPVEFIRQ